MRAKHRRSGCGKLLNTAAAPHLTTATPKDSPFPIDIDIVHREALHANRPEGR